MSRSIRAGTGVRWGLTVILVPLWVSIGGAFWGGDKEEVVERLPEKEPHWVGRTFWEDQEYQYYVRSRSGADSPESGQEAAVTAALRDIATFLGVKVEASHSETLTAEETADAEHIARTILDQIHVSGRADFRGAQLTEVFWEKIRHKGLEREHYAFNVHVLVRFPQSVIREIERNHRRRLQEAVRFLEQGREQARAGAVCAGLVDLYRGVRLSRQVPERIEDPQAGSAVAVQERAQAAYEDQASALTLSADHLSSTGLVEQAHPEMLRAVVRHRAAVGRVLPVAGLPLRFCFRRGQGLLQAEVGGQMSPEVIVHTDEHGEATCRIARIHSLSRNNIVEAVPACGGDEEMLPRAAFPFVSTVDSEQGGSSEVVVLVNGAAQERSFRDGDTLRVGVRSSLPGYISLFVLLVDREIHFVHTFPLLGERREYGWTVEQDGGRWVLAMRDPWTARIGSGPGVETIVAILTEAEPALGQDRRMVEWRAVRGLARQGRLGYLAYELIEAVDEEQ